MQLAPAVQAAIDTSGSRATTDSRVRAGRAIAAPAAIQLGDVRKAGSHFHRQKHS